MKYDRKIIYGDFLDSFIYDGKLIIHLNDNRLAGVEFQDKKDCVEINEENIKNRYVQLREFLTDFDLYKEKLYYCDSRGVFCIPLNQIWGRKDFQEQKLWDANIQCIKAGENGRIALSASQDGLFEYDLDESIQINQTEKKIEKNIEQISKKHSSYCRWTNGSLLNGSNDGDNFLIEFSKDKKTIRCVGEHTERDIFGEPSSNAYLTVSENEKRIFRITNDRINIVKYTQSKKGNLCFDKEEDINLQMSGIEDFSIIKSSFKEKEKIFVIEFNDMLAVINQTGNLLYKTNIGEDIVRWRTFPHSRKYDNQLHIIYNDRLEIMAF